MKIYQIAQEYDNKYKKEIVKTNRIWKYSVSSGDMRECIIPKPFNFFERAVIEKMLKDREEYLVQKFVRKIALKLEEEKIEIEEFGEIDKKSKNKEITEIDEIIEFVDFNEKKYENKKNQKRRITYLQKKYEELKESILKFQKKLAKLESKMSKKIKFFDGQSF